jgi:predicted transcriptional regulator
LKPYRSRLDIIANILESAQGGGAKLTKLLYGSSLSSKRMQELLPLLIASGLIEKREDGFATTDKGRRYARVYGELMSMLSMGSPGFTILDPALVQKASDLVESARRADRERGALVLQGRTSLVLQAAAYYVLARREEMPFTLYDASRLFGVSVTPVRKAKKLLEGFLPS